MHPALRASMNPQVLDQSTPTVGESSSGLGRCARSAPPCDCAAPPRIPCNPSPGPRIPAASSLQAAPMHATTVYPTRPRISAYARWLPLALALLLPQAQAMPPAHDDFDTLTQAIDTFKRDTRYPAGTAVIVVKD